MQIIFSEKTDRKTRNKWLKMCSNKGFFYSSFLTCGFSTWYLTTENNKYVIVGQSEMYGKDTLVDLYKNSLQN